MMIVARWHSTRDVSTNQRRQATATGQQRLGRDSFAWKLLAQAQVGVCSSRTESLRFWLMQTQSVWAIKNTCCTIKHKFAKTSDRKSLALVYLHLHYVAHVAAEELSKLLLLLLCNDDNNSAALVAVWRLLFLQCCLWMPLLRHNVFVVPLGYVRRKIYLYNDKRWNYYHYYCYRCQQCQRCILHSIVRFYSPTVCLLQIASKQTSRTE